jgi:hypothetical protein
MCASRRQQVVALAFASVTVGCTAPSRGVIWQLRSGARMEVVYCAVDSEDDSTVLRWGAVYRTRHHDRGGQQAEALALLRELRHEAEQESVNVITLDHLYEKTHLHWDSGAALPRVASREVSGFTYRRCTDGQWKDRLEGGCPLAGVDPKAIARLGDGTGADPRRVLCRLGGDR